MDAGFCVLEALTRLRSLGVFASIIIKKKGWWPKGIDGDAIKMHMDTKPVGAVNTLKGEQNNIKFASRSQTM